MNSSRCPDVTVVIPAYNGAPFIREAIQSCIGQSDSSFLVHVLVVDDHSSDNTCDVVRSLPGQITLLQHETNQGRHVARNDGLAAATGRYVKFLDQDDFLEPNTLKAEFELACVSDADIVIAGHRTVEQGDDGQLKVVSEKHEPPPLEPRIPAILDGKAVPTAAALYKRSYLDGLTWDGDVPRLDDWDWFVRAALRMGKIVPIAHVSYSWRRHCRQYTHSSTLHQYARDHQIVLRKVEQWLHDNDAFTDPHKGRLAQYYYKMLRAFYKFDRPIYRRTLKHIFELDPAFFPYCEPRNDVRRACQILGVRGGLFVYYQAADAYGGLQTLFRSFRHREREQSL